MEKRWIGFIKNLTPKRWIYRSSIDPEFVEVTADVVRIMLFEKKQEKENGPTFPIF